MSLNEVEQTIVKGVVHRFVAQREATPRKPLLIKARSPETLDRLVKCAVLRAPNNQAYLPMALAFHHSGDSDALRLARKSLEVVLHVLQNMFEVEWEKTDFTPADVEAHARKMYEIVEPETIWMGLYLAQEFNAFSQWSGNQSQTEFSTLRISDRILTVKVETAWESHVQRWGEYLKQANQAGVVGPSLGKRWFDEKKRVQLNYLVSDCLTQSRPGDIEPRGDREFAALDEMLRRRLGRLSLGSGRNEAQIIQEFILRAPEEEIFALIEGVPQVITNTAQGRPDPIWAQEVTENPDEYGERAIQALNQFLGEISCPARFLPNGKFDKEGLDDVGSRELLSLPNLDALKLDLDTLLSGRVLVSLIFIDLDGFKQVNEQLGHLEGNECLQRVIQVISEVVRSKGRLYRYGGDEFTITLRNFEIEEATATAERLRKAIEKANIGGSVPVTASVGVATAGIGVGVNSPEALIRAADDAGGVSKHTGKNRVTTWPPSPEANAAAEISRKKSVERSQELRVSLDERDAAFSKAERQMPELLAEMRKDLAENPLGREFVILKKTWRYWAKGNELVYYYEEHPDLDNKLRILQNLGLIEDIAFNDVARYVVSEEFAEYLTDQS